MTFLTHEIVLTQFDHTRLQGLVRVLRERSGVNVWNLDALESGLTRARTVAPDSIPSDVITMNSKVTLRDLATSELISLTLVFPDGCARDQQRVPVLSPLGLALLGCRVGDVVEHNKPDGTQKLLVEKLDYQPEARGNFFM